MKQKKNSLTTVREFGMDLSAFLGDHVGSNVMATLMQVHEPTFGTKHIIL
jgi:hypothetical protein